MRDKKQKTQEDKMKLTNAILELIKESSNPLSRREIAYISNCSEVAVSRSLKELLDKGQIVNIGTGRQVRYGVEQNIPMYQTNVYVTDFKKIKNANELISLNYSQLCRESG